MRKEMVARMPGKKPEKIHFADIPRGRRPKYPWKKWFAEMFAGRPVIIKRGVDYMVQPHIMIGQFRGMAGPKHYNCRLGVQVAQDSSTLRIRIKKGDK
jgi:hypothetical protein